MPKTYYLLEFDGDIMFQHSDNYMYIVAEFNGYNNISDAVRALVSDKKFFRKTFFYDDDDQNDPSKITLAGIQNYDKEKVKQLLEYYYVNTIKDKFKDSKFKIIHILSPGTKTSQFAWVIIMQ